MTAFKPTNHYRYAIQKFKPTWPPRALCPAHTEDQPKKPHLTNVQSPPPPPCEPFQCLG